MAYDYTQLQADIVQAARRSDYAGARAQRFIAEGEVRIRERLEGYTLKTILDDTVRVVAGSNEYTLPSRTLLVRHIIPSSGPPLEQVDETLSQSYETSSSVLMFSVRPTTVFIAGLPSAGASFELHCIALPAPLDAAANSTNTLLQEHQLLYKQMALVSLYQETRDWDAANTALSEGNSLIDDINRRIKKLLGGKRGASPYNLSFRSSY